MNPQMQPATIKEYAESHHWEFVEQPLAYSLLYRHIFGEQDPPEGYERGIDAALMSLTLKERWVIRLWYKNPKETYKDIGARVGVSGHRIKQVLDKALRRLRHPSKGAVIQNPAWVPAAVNSGPFMEKVEKDWREERAKKHWYDNVPRWPRDKAGNIIR